VEETDGVLWAPVRYVSTKDGEANKIEDLVWLPTEREMYEGGIIPTKGGTTTYGPYSVTTDETASNQARLEYYRVIDGDPNDRRAKFWTGTVSSDSTVVTDFSAYWYWEASPYSGSTSSFCDVGSDGAGGSFSAGISEGCAPAFCVK
jgi:hypothetical protein